MDFFDRHRSTLPKPNIGAGSRRHCRSQWVVWIWRWGWWQHLDNNQKHRWRRHYFPHRWSWLSRWRRWWRRWQISDQFLTRLQRLERHGVKSQMGWNSCSSGRTRRYACLSYKSSTWSDKSNEFPLAPSSGYHYSDKQNHARPEFRSRTPIACRRWTVWNFTKYEMLRWLFGSFLQALRDWYL